MEDTFEQVSYGLQPEDLARILPQIELAPPLPEIPMTLRLNRWEAKDLELIPEKEGPAGKGRMGLKDVFEQRKTERKGIKSAVLELLRGMEEAELKEILGLGNSGNAVASGSGSGKRDMVDVVEVDIKEKKKKGVKVDQEVEAMDVDAEAGEVAEKKKSTRKPKEEVRLDFRARYSIDQKLTLVLGRSALLL